MRFSGAPISKRVISRRTVGRPHLSTQDYRENKYPRSRGTQGEAPKFEQLPRHGVESRLYRLLRVDRIAKALRCRRASYGVFNPTVSSLPHVMCRLLVPCSL